MFCQWLKCGLGPLPKNCWPWKVGFSQWHRQTDRQKNPNKKNYYIKKIVTKKKSQESCVTNMNCDKKNYLKGLVTQVFLGKPFFVGTLKKSIYIYIFRKLLSF